MSIVNWSSVEPNIVVVPCLVVIKPLTRGAWEGLKSLKTHMQPGSFRHVTNAAGSTPPKPDRKARPPTLAPAAAAAVAPAIPSWSSPTLAASATLPPPETPARIVAPITKMRRNSRGAAEEKPGTPQAKRASVAAL